MDPAGSCKSLSCGMRLYIEQYKHDGDPAHINYHIAAEGFRHFGFHIITIQDATALPQDDTDYVAVGSIQFIKAALQHLDKPFPEGIDYPVSLEAYLGRRIWSSTINEISSDPDRWQVFVKPKIATKRFTGRLIRSLADLRATGDQFDNIPVWVSEPVAFKREWRVFVRYGRILDVRPYKGDWRYQYDSRVIELALAAFEDAPAAYAMDWGVTADGRTLLVEVNEGYSVGAYGLYFTDYARFLSARWAQLTGTTDLCAFDLADFPKDK